MSLEYRCKLNVCLCIIKHIFYFYLRGTVLEDGFNIQIIYQAMHVNSVTWLQNINITLKTWKNTAWEWCTNNTCEFCPLTSKYKASIIRHEKRKHGKEKVDEENKAIKTKVNIGDRYNGFVEIIEGINSGDKIVAEGLKKVRPNGKIKPLEKGAQQQSSNWKKKTKPKKDEQKKDKFDWLKKLNIFKKSEAEKQ